MTASAITRPGERERSTFKIGQIDWAMTGAICLIGAAGTAMLFSIAGQSWEPWAFNHAWRFAVCVVMMLGMALIGLRVWFVLAYPAYVLALVLLLLVGGEDYHTPLSVHRLGATRWLHLGAFTIQPSEIMKIAVVLALARFYHGLPAKDANLSWKLIAPALMIVVPVGIVMRQPDLGTSILILFTGAAVMVMAGLSFRLIIPLIAAGALTLPAVVLFVLKDYQRERVMTLFNPEANGSDAGYQIIQSKIALGSGGVLGQGFGLGPQSQLSFLPEKQTDFIFATLAEEFGFVGCVSVLALFAAVIFMALRTAAVAHSHFARLVAAGVTATFALYVLINSAMVMGLAPVVGIPMPLLSYGGTVMLTVMFGFGLVQSVRVHRYDEVGRAKGLI